MKKIKARPIIQLIFFLLFPGAFNGAFAGIKYIFTQIGLSKLVEATSLVAILVALCGYTMVWGRFFCGFACAFGSLGDLVRNIYLYLCKKRRKKTHSFTVVQSELLSLFKYAVLLAIIILNYRGIYGKTRGYSPWDVFSMIRVGNFEMGEYVVGIVFFIIILILMAMEERGFCKFVCPMGAVFSLLPILPIFGLVRDRGNCISKCKACTIQCPSNISLPETGKINVQGDCFMCQKCIGRCPRSNVHTRLKKLKGDELYFIIARAFLLGIILYALGL